MSPLISQFQQHWNKQFPNISLQQNRFLIAISGGVDSVVLAHIMKQCGTDCMLAHCNFQLRSDESNRDEAFVRQFAEELKTPLEVIHFNTNEYAAKHHLSIQEAARVLRYKWFNTIREQHTIKWLLTAHHADDNIETVLMHFFRGTGIKGMTGIPFLQNEQSIIRPLLHFHKTTLLEYANEQGLNFVEDSSNKKEDYTRNFFRLNLIPQIKKIFPQVEENIIQNIDRFADANMLYENAIAAYKQKLVVIKGNEVHIPILLLKKKQPLTAIVWEIIKDYGFTAHQTDEVIKLLSAQSGSFILSSSHRIILNRNWLLIVPNDTAEGLNIQIEEGEKLIRFPLGELKLEQLGLDNLHKIPNDKDVACIDSSEIRFPLLLRKWKQGDYFYPLGMTKKKKLSRFFIDQKLSITDKEKIWVIESQQKILWIVGQRIDNRYKVGANTKNILKITWTSK